MESVPRNSRGAANSSGTAKEVSALWVASESRAVLGTGATPRRGLSLLRLSGRSRSGGPSPSRWQRLGRWTAPSGRLPNSPDDADPGCPVALAQPGESEELKKQSERVGEGAGAICAGERTNGSEPTRCPRAPRTSSGGAHVWRRQVPFGGPTEPAQFPFSEAGI